MARHSLTKDQLEDALSGAVSRISALESRYGALHSNHETVQSEHEAALAEDKSLRDGVPQDKWPDQGRACLDGQAVLVHDMHAYVENARQIHYR